jgi:hypothetical protein
MPKLPILDHTHSFVKVPELMFGQVHWKCILPGCFLVRKHLLMEGAESLCPDCKQESLILTPDMMRRKRPVCWRCSNRAKDIRRRELEQKRLQEEREALEQAPKGPF